MGDLSQQLGQLYMGGTFKWEFLSVDSGWTKKTVATGTGGRRTSCRPGLLRISKRRSMLQDLQTVRRRWNLQLPLSIGRDLV